MTAPYFHYSSGPVPFHVTAVPALNDPPSEANYVVAPSKQQVTAGKMAARLHGKPEPRIISLRSSSEDDVLTILSDGQPRTTDCIYRELHAAYQKLPRPWRWLFKIIPYRWEVSNQLHHLWGKKRIARYGNGDGWATMDGWRDR